MNDADVLDFMHTRVAGVTVNDWLVIFVLAGAAAVFTWIVLMINE